MTQLYHVNRLAERSSSGHRSFEASLADGCIAIKVGHSFVSLGLFFFVAKDA
jgi:hypothetical protein